MSDGQGLWHWLATRLAGGRREPSGAASTNDGGAVPCAPNLGAAPECGAPPTDASPGDSGGDGDGGGGDGGGD